MTEPLVVIRNPNRVASVGHGRVFKNPSGETFIRDSGWASRARTALRNFRIRGMPRRQNAPRFTFEEAALIMGLPQHELLELADRGLIIQSFEIRDGRREQMVRADDLARLLIQGRRWSTSP